MNSFKKKYRILLVDDSLLNIIYLKNALEEDYEVISTTDGNEALKIAKSTNPPSIILLDIIMPEISGFEICKKLKEDDITKEIPVIFITSLQEEKEEEYGLSIGAIDFIKKPFCIPIVKIRIKNHLELKKYRDMLKEISFIDGLTQIPNRRRFNEVLISEWHIAKCNKMPLSVLLIDIDFFKKFNDTYGHLEGDNCLQKVAKSIKTSLNHSSYLVARWGGEEFSCILPNTNNEDALKIGDYLREVIMNLNIPNEHSNIIDKVTVSIGATTLNPTDEYSCEQLLKKADLALYRAKETGRNKVSI